MMLEENGEDKVVKESNGRVWERIGEKITLLNNICLGK